MRRYYPGFFGALFLVLLRIAIGWHLLYEGMQKVMSTDDGKTYLGKFFAPTKGPTFTSEGYQRNATGPFANEFRNLIPDVDSRSALNFETLKASWVAEKQAIEAFYAYSKEQQDACDKELAAKATAAQAWFDDQDNRDSIRKYLDGLDSLAALDAKPNKMSYEVERFYDARKSLESARRSLVAPITAWTASLRGAWTALATNDQKKNGDYVYKPAVSEVQRADYITMIGLTACGLCLMLGLFTPIAAVGAAGFLSLFYISMPPWPGLPEAPNAEGHYSIVNKNLIELVACLALAVTPTGLWMGLDSILFGWIGRIRERRALARLAHDIAEDISSDTHDRVTVTRSPKTR